MERLQSLLACPACGGEIADRGCVGCGLTGGHEEGVARFRLPGDERTECVRRFYDANPFPNYPPNDSLAWLRARAERSEFARLLDASIPGDARIVEIGCGTGQMSLYLARADRVVIGCDLSAGALALAASAARRYGLTGVGFVEADLARLPLKAGAFDIVYCSGVLHHTPDPAAAFASIVRAARPGGFVVVGLYNLYARLPLCLRRGVARLTGWRWIPFDPVLRERRGEPARREAWLRDQYRHPEEHRHSLAEIRRWFDRAGVDFVRTYPTTLVGETCEDLFMPAEDEWSLESLISQIGWMHSLGGEGGLFVTVGRRR